MPNQHRQKWVESWDWASKKSDQESPKDLHLSNTFPETDEIEHPWSSILRDLEEDEDSIRKTTNTKGEINARDGPDTKEETAPSSDTKSATLNPKANIFAPRENDSQNICNEGSTGRTGLETSRWAPYKHSFTTVNGFDCFNKMRLIGVENLKQDSKSGSNKESVTHQAEPVSGIIISSINSLPTSSHVSSGVMSFAAVSDTGLGQNSDINDIKVELVVNEVDPRGRESRGSDQDWNETRKPKRREAYRSLSPGPDSALQFFLTSREEKEIKIWIERLVPGQSNFLHSGLHEKHDINPTTGELIDPVRQPKTKPCPYPTSRPFRIYYKCSDDAVKVQCEEMRIWEKKQARKAEKIRARQAEAELQRQNELNEVLYREKWGPKIPAHFRPATEDDMNAVAELYNREALETCRVPDLEPVEDGMFKILAKWSFEDDMPFVVAVSGDYHEHCPELSSTIIGFAFVERPRGIGGSYHTTECYTGRIRIVVHPDFRRKRIANCLLDSVVGFFSLNYTSHRHYQFVNPNNDPRFDSARLGDKLGKARRLRYLDVEFGINSAPNQADLEKGDEYLGLTGNMALYSFRLVRHDIKYYNCPHVSRKGTAAWMDRLVFTHECRDWNTMRYS